MKYFLEVREEKKKTAQTKAVVDCERIMKEEGYEGFFLTGQFLHKFHLFDAAFAVNCMKLNSLGPSDTLLIRLPFYISDRAYRVLFHDLDRLKKKKTKIIVLIHDLNSVRFEEERAYQIERTFFRLADAVIAHNTEMARYLVERYQLAPEKIVSLGLFDYCCDQPAENRNSLPGNRIIIAGNLSRDKAGYIYNAPAEKGNQVYHLYGAGAEEDLLPANMVYKGAYEPEELPAKLDGDYGLIWDGPSCGGCEGAIGEYLRLNNPHKFSLYIAAEKPVIIWKEAALARVVQEEGIGLTVSSMNEIEEAVSKVSADDYALMKKNLRGIGRKVRSGGYIRTALRRAEDIEK